MIVYWVGNPAVEGDNLPYKLLPKLHHAFPTITFIEIDPTESFIPEDGSIIIDTVQGISDVRWFENLDNFLETKRVSVHDYDLGLHLKLLQKLHKTQVRILGIPQGKSIEDIVPEVMRHLQENPYVPS